ncbi:hypothetical protein GHA01_30480 [Novacetimonas hansenii]|uniref:Transposase n=1 Tax=Novacetimonas hansenii TaxID=436 RepID=A0ABQ0SIT4_NOVHA|nr:hypothetical protein AA0243_3121 [Novacetimonas hansenii NRIC 0243]GEC65199.1 hypothetical protein GHA01_30480 [Novacetimonas hansenii]
MQVMDRHPKRAGRRTIEHDVKLVLPGYDHRLSLRPVGGKRPSGILGTALRAIAPIIAPIIARGHGRGGMCGSGGHRNGGEERKPQS